MRYITGQGFKEMMAAGARSLERQAQAIDSLNVFPVPDGDTGTNMLLTMRSTLAEASRCSERGAGMVAQAMARGALMGARGNSGVILSQILRGMAQGLKGKERLDGPGLSLALKEAVAAAYKGVSQPVEGTILTVLREAAAAAQGQNGKDVVALMEMVVSEARASVLRTPHLLPVLRQAGVVDAGGQGLLAILEGALRYLRGERLDEEAEAPSPSYRALAVLEEADYGYCTEFLLSGQGLSEKAVRKQLSQWGESVMVVGDEALLRIHIHTHDSGRVLSYAVTLGTLSQVKIENMLEQRREVVGKGEPQALPLAPVAVAAGEGLARLLSSLGASAIVPGGQTMNPSVEELLRAVESVASEKVILLPNNPNIIPAAQQAAGLAQKRVEVVPARSIPQGIAALLALSYEASFEDNLERMRQALARVKTGEVTRATRSNQWGDLFIKKGDFLGLLEGEPAVTGRTPVAALKGLLLKMCPGEEGLVTIYYASEEDGAALASLRPWMRRRLPGQEMEIVCGGQPHYHYIVSVE
ncbi:MAG: DAK2 domain-containing protein [Chloroflexi bacterium]|nr:DAK2 domain-containing protein [Chloroflexota bacterium]